MEFIPLPALIEQKKYIDDLKIDIVDHVKKIQKFTNADDIELANYIATIVENLVTNKKLDKMGLVLDVFKDLFNDVTPQQLQAIERNIEHLLKINAIKRVPILKKLTHYTYEIVLAILKKKVLES
jgi:hypothetical protein